MMQRGYADCSYNGSLWGLVKMFRRILIVEPDPKTARELFLLFHFEYERFERERYEPEIASCLAEAVEQVQTINFHCVIMNVDLPEMKGYDAVPLIRKLSNGIPIIMTADTNTLELETKVREQDAYYYHIRGSNEDELQLAVQSIFEERQTVRGSRKPDNRGTRLTVLRQLRLRPKAERQGVDPSTNAISQESLQLRRRS